MKNQFLRPSLVMGLLMVLLFLTPGCNRDFKGTEINSINEKEVIESLEEFNTALTTKDYDVLSKMTSESLTYGHSSGNIQNKKEFLDEVVNGSFQFGPITNENLKVITYGNTAVARYILSSEGIRNGEPAPVRIGIMMVFQAHKGERPVLIARQAYKL